MELGITTFAETTPRPVHGIGEHHRADFAASSPAVVLAAAAARTSRIHLTSAVTVLSSDDPVRVFQDFAALDLLSQGRAEIIAGRGSFTESFPLFGHDLTDHDALFIEKLELLLAIRDHERVTGSGRHRAPLTDQAVYPRAHEERLPIWIGVGGDPQSVHAHGFVADDVEAATGIFYPPYAATMSQLGRERGWAR